MNFEDEFERVVSVLGEPSPENLGRNVTAFLELCAEAAGGGGVRLLADGSVGFDAARLDDGFRAAAASVLGVPAAGLPDVRLAGRLALGLDPEEVGVLASWRWEKWAAGVGLELRVGEVLPLSGRWMGVVRGVGEFAGHCPLFGERLLVFSDGDLLHDPLGWSDDRQFSLSDVAYGIWFMNKKEMGVDGNGCE